MSEPAAPEPEFLTADQVCDRLADEPALRPVAAFCVLPMVWVEGCVRFCRKDLEAWIGRERALRMRRARTDAVRLGRESARNETTS